MFTFFIFVGISKYLKLEARGNLTKTKRGKPLGYYVLQPENFNSYPVWRNTFGFYLFRTHIGKGGQGSARWLVRKNLMGGVDMVLYPRPGANSPLDKTLTWIFYDRQNGGWHYDPEYFKISVHDKGMLFTNYLS